MASFHLHPHIITFSTLKSLLEKDKNGLPVIRETMQMNTLEVATSLNIPRQDFKTSSGQTVRFMHCKGLVHWKNALEQNLPTDYVEKFIAYQCLIF
jgi:hypothetical protein